MPINLSPQALARGSSRRPRTIIAVWSVVFLVAGALIVTLLGDALTTEVTFTNNPESQRGFDLLEERLRGPERVNEVVIVRSGELTVEDAAFRGMVEGLFADILALGDEVIAGGGHYYQPGNESMASTDGRTTILSFVMVGEVDEAGDNVHLLRKVVDEADENSDFQVLLTGTASVNKEFQDLSAEDLRKGETFAIPVALVILILVFGALAAAIVPMLLAIVAIAVALGASALIGQVFEFSFFVVNMITMIGLAVGIDYSLLIVSRYREERGRGLDKLEAIAAAGATANRTVLFSGIMVGLALLGMLIVPATIFRSLAAGAILVVIFAVLASLTLLPAVLSLMGDRVNALRVPFIQRAGYGEQRRGGLWDRIARAVMRRPVVSLAVAGGLLLAAAIPALGLNTGFAGVSTMPDRLESKMGFDILEEQFSFGLVTPAEIVIDGAIDSEPVQ
ncbi:MAG: MMPL family transporter, partial [Dehalococcoidia bacterium]